MIRRVSFADATPTKQKKSMKAQVSGKQKIPTSRGRPRKQIQLPRSPPHVSLNDALIHAEELMPPYDHTGLSVGDRFSVVLAYAAYLEGLLVAEATEPLNHKSVPIISSLGLYAKLQEEGVLPSHCVSDFHQTTEKQQEQALLELFPQLVDVQPIEVCSDYLVMLERTTSADICSASDSLHVSTPLLQPNRTLVVQLEDICKTKTVPRCDVPGTSKGSPTSRVRNSRSVLRLDVGSNLPTERDGTSSNSTGVKWDNILSILLKDGPNNGKYVESMAVLLARIEMSVRVAIRAVNEERANNRSAEPCSFCVAIF